MENLPETVELWGRRVRSDMGDRPAVLRVAWAVRDRLRTSPRDPDFARMWATARTLGVEAGGANVSRCLAELVGAGLLAVVGCRTCGAPDCRRRGHQKVYEARIPPRQCVHGAAVGQCHQCEAQARRNRATEGR